jgi:hypothetical protein
MSLGATESMLGLPRSQLRAVPSQRRPYSGSASRGRGGARLSRHDEEDGAWPEREVDLIKPGQLR